MAATQALELRDYTPGIGTRAAIAEVRRHVDFLEQDRPLHGDHNAMLEAVRNHLILDAVEAEIGPLASY
jgi:histidine ammonia-lyase